MEGRGESYVEMGYCVTAAGKGVMPLRQVSGGALNSTHLLTPLRQHLAASQSSSVYM